jgi:hypothetical protein
VKHNWHKIAIILVIITVAVGAATPLFGDGFTKLFYSPSYPLDLKSPEGRTAATMDYSAAQKVEGGQPSAGWEFGSFILLGSGMLIFANWGRRKARR